MEMSSLLQALYQGKVKTYTSTNLALSISQEVDSTVLLIDGDVAKQGISRMLGLEKMSGMVDVLESNELSIGDVHAANRCSQFNGSTCGYAK